MLSYRRLTTPPEEPWTRPFPQGQVIIPKSIRDELGIEAGAKLKVTMEGRSIVMEASRPFPETSLDRSPAWAANGTPARPSLRANGSRRWTPRCIAGGVASMTRAAPDDGRDRHQHPRPHYHPRRRGDVPARSGGLVEGPVLVPTTVLLEAEWVLRGRYGLDRGAVADSLTAFLGLATGGRADARRDPCGPEPAARRHRFRRRLAPVNGGSRTPLRHPRSRSRAALSALPLPRQSFWPSLSRSTSHDPVPVRLFPLRRHPRRAPPHAGGAGRQRAGGSCPHRRHVLGRGYNIESLTVSETEHEKHVSRITIVTTGTEKVIEQIKTQLDRLVPVHRVVDLTVQGEALERELCLVKVRGKGDARVEALRLAGPSAPIRWTRRSTPSSSS